METKSFLTTIIYLLKKITLGNEENETTFSIGEPVKFHGSPLHVAITPDTKKLTIYYATNKDATGIQWLSPEQTTGKKKPLLFTGSCSIWGRSWFPCQDAPSIRFTYTADVTVPKGLLALMSAKNPQQKNNQGLYHFEQKNSIPSYLVALAAGDFQFKAINYRTGVYAEPGIVNKAEWEFADLAKMVDVAESFWGKYRWARYDVLVLPPSFPWGGMENPNITFLTPALISGDRSQVNVLAHELGHSWSGNLVTCASWNDIWLNEGITTYLEHRIDEAMYGREEANMQDVFSRKKLAENVSEMGDTSTDTYLKLTLRGRNPDECFTYIPYEKGYAFMQTIEEAVGRKKIDTFLKNYFESHAFTSRSTEQFLADVNNNLLHNDTVLLQKINEKAWVYSPGIPGNIPHAFSSKFKLIDSILINWRKTGNSKGLSRVIKSTNEKRYFITHLPANLTVKEMVALDSEFDFTNKSNNLIQFSWFLLAVRYHYTPAYPAIENFLTGYARVQLYKEMIKTSEGKIWAAQLFNRVKPGYNNTSVQDIEALLQ